MMSGIKGGYVPFGELGAGTYGASLGRENVKVLSVLKDRILELVKTIPFPEKKSVFSIGDYGSADGSASMAFITDLIVTLRKHQGADVKFQVIYEDQPINDFNSLFKRLSAIIPDPPSYFLELDGVFPMASGVSFYKQCVPSESMHFIMSIIASHWLSKTPVMYKDSVYKYPGGTNEEIQVLNTQARLDWETFLLMRSRELKHGGILLIACGGEYTDENGTIMYTQKSYCHLLTNIWRSFRDTGKITNEEFIATNMACCFYNLKQLREPFEDKNSAVSQSGLRLLSAEILSEITAWKENTDKENTDRRKFVQTFVAAHKNWTYNVFLAGLSDDREIQEKEEIVDDLHQSAEEKLSMMDLEKLNEDKVVSCVIIRKK